MMDPFKGCHNCGDIEEVISIVQLGKEPLTRSVNNDGPK